MTHIGPFKKNLFIWLHYILVVACELRLPHSMWNLSSLTRDWTPLPALESGFLSTEPSGKSHAVLSHKRFKFPLPSKPPNFIMKIKVMVVVIIIIIILIKYLGGLPWWLSGRESTCQCRRHGFNPWVRKIPWRRKWQSTPVFLTGKSHGQRNLVSYSPSGHNLVTNQHVSEAWRLF